MPDTDLQRMIHGHPDDELVSALEPDQLVAAGSRPLPRYAQTTQPISGYGCCA